MYFSEYVTNWECSIIHNHHEHHKKLLLSLQKSHSLLQKNHLLKIQKQKERKKERKRETSTENYY
jgi:hypothetical protein